MFELLTGVTMFQTHSNFEHLCMMQHILGPIPKCLLEGSKKLKYFNESSLVNLDWSSSEGQYIINNCKPLRVSTFFWNLFIPGLMENCPSFPGTDGFHFLLWFFFDHTAVPYPYHQYSHSPTDIKVSFQYYQRDYSTELQQIFNLMEGLLQYDPKERLTCSQALRHPFFDHYILKKRNSPHWHLKIRQL